MRPLLLLLPLLVAPPAAAQWRDGFADGDFTAAPAWTGTAGGWTVAPFRGGYALRTRGGAASDTLYLSTSSPAAYGRWAFTVAWAGVNPSNFNGVRVYLVADAPALDGPVHGYYVQLGTNNADEVRLYRQDGRAHRLLGRGPPTLADGADTLGVVAERTRGGAWTVAVHGDTLIAAADDTYDAGGRFGVWVKHTAATADGYAFTNFAVDPAPAPPDTTAPVLRAARHAGGARVEAVFSEPALGCDPSRWRLDPGARVPMRVDGCAAGAARDTFALVFARALDVPSAHTLAAYGAADPSGNARTRTAVSFFAGSLGAPGPGDVVVNEVMYAPPDGVPEYVELLGRSAAWLDLSALTIEDAGGAPVHFDGAPFALAPGAYAVLTADAPAFAAAFPGVPHHKVDGLPVLNNSGDAVVLRAGGGVVDGMTWSGGAAGVSLERVDPAGPSDAAFNWAPSDAPASGTPGARNSRWAPDRTPPGVVFVEEMADGEVEVVFTEPLDPSVGPEAFTAEGVRPDSVWAAGENAWRLRFPGARTAAAVDVRGVRDRTGNVLAAASAVVARRPGPGDLVVNEILAAPLADRYDGRPDQPEYVELYNRAAHPVTLRGAYWTDAEDENGAADTLRLTEGPVAVPPGGYAVVYAAQTGDAADGDAGDVLARAFPDADLGASAVVRVPLARTSLRLAASEDEIRLHRRDGAAGERVAYRAAWHRPDLFDPAGVALERRAPGAPAEEATSWTSAVHPDGGTPGGPNSILRPPVPPGASPGVTAVPVVFTPDADGRDDAVALAYRLRMPTGLLRVRVFDAHGRAVRTLAPARLTAAEGAIAWDGFDDGGRALPAGPYVAHLEAVDAEGGTVEAYRVVVVLAR